VKKLFNFYTIYAAVLVILNINYTQSKIHIVCTAALIPEQYAVRQDEYTKSLLKLHEFGFIPYVVEPCLPKNSHTFLDDYAIVYYSNTNNFRLINKGVNECVSLLAAFSQWTFDDEDIIIKTTGRYYFNTDHFIQLINQHPECDMFIRWGKGQPIEFVSAGHVFTGCYAIRYKYFKDMLNRINFNTMEHALVPVEAIVAEYATKCLPPEKVMAVEKLDMTARVGYGCSLSQW